MAKKLTSAKAKEILHDKEVHGHPLTDKQRKFFGAIAGGAKPYKAQDGGWLDKYEQGGLVLKQKTKDNYDLKPNANESQVTLPPGFVGMGNNIQGRNYSPAWGGQFQDGGNLMPPMAGADTSVPMYQMGGSMPGAVGFMYARTQSPAPSNGPYAKKTKASAQNGAEMKYYQEGLDFTPKTISQDGSRTPLYVSDPNDPRLKAYNDSLRLYKAYKMQEKLMGPGRKPSDYKFKWTTDELKKGREKKIVKGLEDVGPISEDFQSKQDQFKEGFNFLTARREDKKLIDYYESLGFKPSEIMYHSSPDVVSDKIRAIGTYFDGTAQSPIYKKPVQPIVLQELVTEIEPRFEKPIPIPRDTIDLGYTLPTPGQPTAPELYKYSPDTPTKFSFTYPTGKYNEQKTMYFPSKSALKSFTEGVRGATYQEGKDYASATGNLQDGGDLKLIPRATGDMPSYVPKIDPKKEQQAAVAKKNQAAREAIERQGEIKPYVPQSSNSKTWEIATNPIEALGYKIRGERLPEHFSQGQTRTSGLNAVMNTLNPYQIINSGIEFLGGTGNIIKDVATGDFESASSRVPSTILHGLGAAPMLSAFPKGSVIKGLQTLSDLPRAKNIEEALGRIGGIPYERDIPRMAMEDVKALRQVQEIGRLRSTGSSKADQMKHALQNNLPEEHFQKVFNTSRKEAKDLLDSGFGQSRPVAPQVLRSRSSNIPSSREAFIEDLRNDDHVLHGQEPGVVDIVGRENIDPVSSDIVFGNLSDDQLQALRNYADDFNAQADRDFFGLSSETSPSESPRSYGRIDLTESMGTTSPRVERDLTSDLNISPSSLRDIFRNIEGEEPQGFADADLDIARDEYIRNMLSSGMQPRSTTNVRNIQPFGARKEALTESLRQNVNRYRNVPGELQGKLENFMISNMQKYPYYSGRVEEQVPSLFLSEGNRLKNVSNRVNFAPEGIQSGTVFTGSTNTSHSSYLPQLKQVFKYTQGDPQFLGYKPMNTLGFLSSYGYESGDISRYLNTEIDEQIRRGIIPKNIQRPYVKGESVLLPHYGVRQHREGGVVKDDMGYWNPENWGKVVEIDSNNITMQGVDQPLLGISDTGDVQYMEPGKDYKFKGKKVKEYPVGKKGVSVNKADENPNQKLDQLLNFTNYNKPTNGGWLDKYK